MVGNSLDLDEKFRAFSQDDKKQLLIIVIDGRTKQQRSHIPYVRQLIDKLDRTSNGQETSLKHFLVIVHSPAQTIYHQASFPSIFLDHWDFYFFDTCLPNKSFYIQNLLKILTSSTITANQHDSQEIIFNYNVLFDECLWDFCSRLQILVHEIPSQLFSNQLAAEFYQRKTSIRRRVECFKRIIERCVELQKRIINKYQIYLTTKKNISKRIYTFIYQIAKELVCGKRFEGLVESIEAQTRLSFSNFICNVLKLFVNDYGLDNLQRFSEMAVDFDVFWNLFDCSRFLKTQSNELFASDPQTTFALVTHHQCLLRTPFYYIMNERIESYAVEIKDKYIRRRTDDQSSLSS